jgi:hypothetical protein
MKHRAGLPPTHLRDIAMKLFHYVAAAGVSFALLAGCSEKTKQETKEMLDEAGDAASSAVEDTKDNVEKAGEVIEAAGDKAKEEFSGDDKPATATDADAAPDAEEEKP